MQLIIADGDDMQCAPHNNRHTRVARLRAAAGTPLDTHDTYIVRTVYSNWVQMCSASSAGHLLRGSRNMEIMPAVQPRLLGALEASYYIAGLSRACREGQQKWQKTRVKQKSSWQWMP